MEKDREPGRTWLNGFFFDGIDLHGTRIGIHQRIIPAVDILSDLAISPFFRVDLTTMGAEIATNPLAVQ